MRLTTACPTKLRALLDDDIENSGRWSTTIANDLHHIKAYISKQHTAPNHDDIRQWIRMAKEEPPKFKSITTHAFKTAVEHSKEQATT
eukprot:1031579-Pyramimonas_sp.AAC.1